MIKLFFGGAFTLASPVALHTIERKRDDKGYYRHHWQSSTEVVYHLITCYEAKMFGLPAWKVHAKRKQKVQQWLHKKASLVELRNAGACIRLQGFEENEHQSRVYCAFSPTCSRREKMNKAVESFGEDELFMTARETARKARKRPELFLFVPAPCSDIRTRHEGWRTGAIQLLSMYLFLLYIGLPAKTEVRFEPLTSLFRENALLTAPQPRHKLRAKWGKKA